MSCKKHLTDLSGSVGVCASCLRERLFALIAAQTEAHHAQEDHRKPNRYPPPLVFPRSASPYISRRKSENSSSDRNRHQNSIADQRFYSTPQIGPGESCRKQRSRFSLFWRLFRSKTEEPGSDPTVSVSNSRNPGAAASPSPSWFSNMLSGRRKKQSRLFSENESTAGFGRRLCRNRDRGMSPARVSDYDDVAECCDGPSGYSSESSPGYRQTSQKTVAGRRSIGRTNHQRNVSGLAFCLSPLVRASPNRQWNQKGMPPEMSFSGDIRVPVKPHLWTAASLEKNRSRKLADLGRYG